MKRKKRQGKESENRNNGRKQEKVRKAKEGIRLKSPGRKGKKEEKEEEM